MLHVAPLGLTGHADADADDDGVEDTEILLDAVMDTDSVGDKLVLVEIVGDDDMDAGIDADADAVLLELREVPKLGLGDVVGELEAATLVVALYVLVADAD